MEYERLNAGLKAVLHQFRRGETVHAYLLTGASGLGKRTFAKVLTSALFCTSAPKPCGVCDGCKRVWDGNEPDVISLFADDGKPIGVDKVRDVVKAVSQHSFGAGFRVVLIEPVEKLTAQAQNCLLKSLEEPVARVVFLLMTHELTATLGTIASRCVRVKLSPWPDDILADALQKRGYERAKIATVLGMCGGNIGYALRLLDGSDAAGTANTFVQSALSLESDAAAVGVSTGMKENRDEGENCLTALEQAIHQTLLVKAGLLPGAALAAYPAFWRQNAPEASADSLNRLLDAVFQARRLRAAQVNWQSAADQLMMTLLEEERKWQRL